MHKITSGVVAVACVVAAHSVGVAETSAAEAKKWRVISEQTASGFAFPESAAYDPKAKMLYVGQFGGKELKPAEKDGQSRISKVSLDGKILEDRFLPAAGETMRKPKGSGCRATMPPVLKTKPVPVAV
jgi:hypothetical protein